MRASLDTNAIIHFYRAGLQNILFDFFDEGVFIYGSGDLGEVYAISLAQTLGAYSFVSDDTKQGGPYMSLLQFVDNDIMPFTFADVLIIRYLSGAESAARTMDEFNEINDKSKLNWSLKSQLTKFRKRFWKEPYKCEDTEWIQLITGRTVPELEIHINALKNEIGI